jgi:hypothetical protein
VVAFVEEDFAANKMWQKTEDGEVDGLQFLPGNLLALALNSPEATCFEFVVEDRPPAMASTVVVDVGCLEWAVNVPSVGLTGNVCPPLHVATDLRGEAYSASSIVAKDGVQLAEEKSCSRVSEKRVMSLTRERLELLY